MNQSINLTGIFNVASNRQLFQGQRVNFGYETVTRSSAIAVIADRTACSILTLFTVIATSRPLNKKKSVCCQSADPTITASQNAQRHRQTDRQTDIRTDGRTTG